MMTRARASVVMAGLPCAAGPLPAMGPDLRITGITTAANDEANGARGEFSRPLLNVNDLVCFLPRFAAAGCS